MRSSGLFALALTSLLFSAHSNAQQFDDAASIDFGAFDFTPTVDVGLMYDDNIVKSDLSRIDSWSRTIAPQLNLFTTYGVSDLRVSYRLVNKDHFSSPEDDFTDHFFRTASRIELDPRNRIDVFVDFADSHDERGSNFSIGRGELLNEPDKFKQGQFDLQYEYGAFNADGRLAFSFNIQDKNYDLNIPTYLARDRKFVAVGAAFLYRVAPAIDASVEINRKYVDYKFAIDPTNPLDSYEDTLLFGVNWEATGSTSGFAKAGYQAKSFDSQFRNDFNGVDWSLGVLWEPSDYADFEFVTSADTDETDGDGNFIRANNFSLEWRHQWLERLRSSAQIKFSNNRYEDQFVDGIDIRSDDVMRFKTSIYYQFRRWMNFEVGYIYDERDSNRDEIDFDRNRLIVNALVTL